MAAINDTDLDAAYKEMYAGQEMQDIVYDEFARPFFTRLEKMEDLAGDFYPLPVLYEDVGGGACTFSIAQAVVAGMELGVFQIDAADYHRVVQIKAKALRKITDVGAFLTKQKVKVDSMLRALANDVEKSLYRKASGLLATYTAVTGISSGVITLTNPSDAKLFNINDALVVAVDEATAPVGAPQVGYVIAKSPENGTITVATSMGGSAATPTGWDGAGVDHIFRYGDYIAGGDTKRLHGLENWMPNSTVFASETTFLGQARSANREALAGIYSSEGSLSNIESSIVTAMSKLGDYFGGNPDLILVDYPLWAAFAQELGITVRRVVRDGKAGVEPISVMGPNGVADVVPCSFCQPNTAWILTLNTWKLYSAGPAVGIFDDDGNSILRVSNDDALETRGVSYPELGCEAPGKNMRLEFS